MTDLHKDLTGADLHEPKGVATATAGQVYEADGAGSGTWTTLSIPTGLFNITTAEFTSSGTWTMPADCFMVKVYCVGAGQASGGAGGTTSFGAYCSATGGSGGTGGTGSGDVNFSGTDGGAVADQNFYEGLPGLQFKNYGRGYNNGTNIGAGGGACIKYLYSTTSTVTVTVGTTGSGTAGGNGYVLVEQYIPV